MSRRSTPADGFIDPARIYTRAAFLRAIGLGSNTAREARRKGIPLPMRTVGRQPLVLGSDGIAWLLRLSDPAEADHPAEAP
ncbi:MAG: hypothetical protein K8T91_21450 [Planctomycetes bacterium]|nr:hypothetical protein [Planctomycetota bacterium]